MVNSVGARFLLHGLVLLLPLNDTIVGDRHVLSGEVLAWVGCCPSSDPLVASGFIPACGLGAIAVWL